MGRLWGEKQESLWLWLGGDKRTNVFAFSFNAILHAAFGATVAAPFLFMPEPWHWIGLGAATVAGAAREYAQYDKNKQLHLLDRVWDTAEAAAGAAFILAKWG